MKQHTKACHDCPWRKKSMPGWLGSEQSPEEWIKTAHGETIVECHIHASQQCAGVAIYRRNICKSPRFKEILVLPADRETIFSSPQQFIDHHRKLGVVSSEL